jgi:hypothetical protein
MPQMTASTARRATVRRAISAVGWVCAAALPGRASDAKAGTRTAGNIRLERCRCMMAVLTRSDLHSMPHLRAT